MWRFGNLSAPLLDFDPQNFQQDIQTFMDLEKDQTPNQKNKSSSPSKSSMPDNKHYLGKQFEERIIHTLQNYNVIDKDDSPYKKSFAFNNQHKDDFKTQIYKKTNDHFGDNRIIKAINECLFQKIKFNSKSQVEVQIDIKPHRRNTSYRKTLNNIAKLNDLSNNYNYLVFENIFQNQFNQNCKIFYTGQIKRNFLNLNQRKMKKFPQFKKQQVVRINRTAQIARKLILIRNDILGETQQIFIQEARRKFRSNMHPLSFDHVKFIKMLTGLNKVFIQKQKENQQVVFFLIIYGKSKSVQQFLADFGEEYTKYLKFFCSLYNTVLDLIVVENQNQNLIFNQITKRIEGLEGEVKGIKKYMQQRFQRLQNQISEIIKKLDKN